MTFFLFLCFPSACQSSWHSVSTQQITLECDGKNRWEEPPETRSGCNQRSVRQQLCADSEMSQIQPGSAIIYTINLLLWKVKL